MTSPQVDECFDDHDENKDIPALTEEYSADSESPIEGTSDENVSGEERRGGKPVNQVQPSEISIACYGAPEDDAPIEFLDRRYALEEEITLENGEKIRYQLTDEQKLRREVIRSLAEARHNRRLFSQQKGGTRI